jgi:hypothetical protein
MLRDNDQGSMWSSVVAVLAVVCAISALYAPLVLR